MIPNLPSKYYLFFVSMISADIQLSVLLCTAFDFLIFSLTTTNIIFTFSIPEPLLPMQTPS